MPSFVMHELQAIAFECSRPISSYTTPQYAAYAFQGGSVHCKLLLLLQQSFTSSCGEYEHCTPILSTGLFSLGCAQTWISLDLIMRRRLRSFDQSMAAKHLSSAKRLYAWKKSTVTLRRR